MRESAMKMGRVRFDDPEELSRPSSANTDFMMNLQLLNYVRRVFERKVSGLTKSKDTTS